MGAHVNILLAVRDTRAVAGVIRALEDGEHCTFHVVHDGLSALKEAKRVDPDILVIDAVLPGMDGLGVADSLSREPRGRSPLVIGGASMPFAREGFLRRGAQCVLPVPWRQEELHAALTALMEKMDSGVDWEEAGRLQERASALLEQIGMHSTLRGFEYLSWAAALACGHEEKLFAVGRRLYQPIAQHLGTSPQNVERLIRHAVESTMNADRAREMYGFFGNTIDPTRGKPTNAQMISALAQRLSISPYPDE